MNATVSWPDWVRLTRIGGAASKDEARPILTGIYFEADDGRLRATATDSYKLATVTVDAEIEEDGPVLIPARQVRIATSAFRQMASAQLGAKFPTFEETQISLIQDGSFVYLEFTVAKRHLGSLHLGVVDTGDGHGFPKTRTLLVKPGKPLAISTLARKDKIEIAEYIRVQSGKLVNIEKRSKKSLLEDVKKIHAQPLERSVGLNAGYLGELAKTTDVKSHPLQIEMFGTVRPIFYSNPGDLDWQGIQMPVRTRHD